MKSFFSCYFNLVKATIGTGLISYPITFHILGYYTIIAIIISSIFSQLGFYFYLKTNKLHGPLSISNLAKKYKYFWFLVAHACVILKTFIVTISYLIALRDIYKICLPVNFEKSFMSIRVLILFHTSLIFPLICFKQLRYLNYSSFLGILSSSYLIFLAIYRYIKSPHLGSINNKLNFPGLISRLPFFVFSFTAHQTIIPLQNDYYSLPLSFFVKVIVASSVTVSCIYSLFGILIAKSLNMNGENYNMLCFNVFPQDVLTQVALIMYIGVLSFSIPLQLLPCRIQLLDIYDSIMQKFNKKKESVTVKEDFLKRVICSLLIVLFCLFIFWADFPMSFFQNCSGGTSSTLLCFILPSALFFGLCWKNSNNYEKISTFSSLFYGTIIFIIFSYQLFKPFFTK